MDVTGLTRTGMNRYRLLSVILRSGHRTAIPVHRVVCISEADNRAVISLDSGQPVYCADSYEEVVDQYEASLE